MGGSIFMPPSSFTRKHTASRFVWNETCLFCIFVVCIFNWHCMNQFWDYENAHMWEEFPENFQLLSDYWYSKDLKPLCFLWSKHRGVEGRRIGESSHPIYHLFYWFGWEQLRHRRRIYDDDPSQTILCVPQSNLANHSALLLLLLLAVSHVWHTYLFSGSIADTLKG